MVPDYRGSNPYQQLLASAIGRAGASVIFPTCDVGVLPFLRTVSNLRPLRAFHLHWTGPYVAGRNLLACFGRMARLWADLLLVRASGIRVVYTMHNALPHDTGRPRLDALMQRVLCRIASRVIVHGSAGRDIAVRLFGCPRRKLAVVPHGHYRGCYQLAVSAAEARCRLGLDPGPRVFLYFGLLRPYKGLEDLLQTWGFAAPEGSGLLVVGHTNERSYADRLVRLAEMAPGVRLINRFVPDDEVHWYFSAADVAVLPFRRVLTSGSAILAMSYGKPIIAPRLGDIPETLGEGGGLLYDPADPKGLQNSLARAAAINLAPLAAKVRAACDRLDWDRIGAATCQLYSPGWPVSR